MEHEDRDRPGFASSKTYVYSGEKAEKAESTSVSQPGKGNNQDEDIGPSGEDDMDSVPDLLEDIAPPTLSVAK